MREEVHPKHLKNPKAFFKCSNAMKDVYSIIEEYNKEQNSMDSV